MGSIRERSEISRECVSDTRIWSGMRLNWYGIMNIQNKNGTVLKLKKANIERNDTFSLLEVLREYGRPMFAKHF